MEVSLAKNVILVPLGENYLKFALPCTCCRLLRTTHKLEKITTDYDEFFIVKLNTQPTRDYVDYCMISKKKKKIYSSRLFILRRPDCIPTKDLKTHVSDSSLLLMCDKLFAFENNWEGRLEIVFFGFFQRKIICVLSVDNNSAQLAHTVHSRWRFHGSASRG